MSGSLKIPLPKLVDPYSNQHPTEDRIPPDKRQAAVKLIMAFYNKYPLRPEEEKLMDRRIMLLQYAEYGWFKLIRRECVGLSMPEQDFLAALTLLES